MGFSMFSWSKTSKNHHFSRVFMVKPVVFPGFPRGNRPKLGTCELKLLEPSLSKTLKAARAEPNSSTAQVLGALGEDKFMVTITKK